MVKWNLQLQEHPILYHMHISCPPLVHATKFVKLEHVRTPPHSMQCLLPVCSSSCQLARCPGRRAAGPCTVRTAVGEAPTTRGGQFFHPKGWWAVGRESFLYMILRPLRVLYGICLLWCHFWKTLPGFYNTIFKRTVSSNELSVPFPLQAPWSRRNNRKFITEIVALELLL